MTLLTLEEFTQLLKGVLEQMQDERPVTAELFQLMYDTGLRVREVLEVERWTPAGNNNMYVSLQKGEGQREFQRKTIPPTVLQHYDSQTPFTLQTYSSVNNTFKYYAPGIITNGDQRRTTTHAFRYRFMQQLAADGLSIAEIAQIMGHLNQANTAKYVTSAIYAGL